MLCTRRRQLVFLSVALSLAACSKDAAPADKDEGNVETDDTAEDDDETGKPVPTDAAPSRMNDASIKRDAGKDAGALDARGVDVPVDVLPDAGGTSDAGTARQPIDPPVADDCITDVSPGDHTFTCSGVTFLVKVTEECTKFACGVIFDVHGATMSGQQMRDNTKLHELAPPLGFITVHPSATPSNTGGTWDLQADPPKVADFLKRTIAAYHVDPKRVHFTGFSQGSAHTFYMLCNHPELLASAAPLSGNSADVSCIDQNWKPRVPFLFMSGITDSSLAIADFRTRVDGFVEKLGLTGGDVIGSDGHYTRKHWRDAEGRDYDFIEHDYGGQPVLAGHCVPGGTDISGSPNNFVLNATTCTTPANVEHLHWGKTALQWFLDHPKP